MKRFLFLTSLLFISFSYGQTISGFVANPSFEDGSVGTITKNQTLNDWKLGGPYSRWHWSFSKHSNS